MSKRIVFAMLSVASTLFLLIPSATMGQGKGKKGGFGNFQGDPSDMPMRGKKGGGGFPGGGFPGGGYPGQGGFPGKGGFGGQDMSGGQQRFPGGFNMQGGGNPMDSLNRMAEAEFNLFDRNGDGFLNMDEMPQALKGEVTKWDINRDNLISLDEYKAYYAARMMSRRGGGGGGGYQQGDTITTIIEEEDLDARPVVFRAGKLPKELPAWFKEMDMDKDGQVGLYEWRKAGKDIDEFAEWDRNNDGFITPEEALYKQNLIQLASAKTAEDDDTPRMRPGNGGSSQMRGKKGPGGGGPGGDFAGKGKKGKKNFNPNSE